MVSIESLALKKVCVLVLILACLFWLWGGIKVKITGTGTYKTAQNTLKTQIEEKQKRRYFF